MTKSLSLSLGGPGPTTLVREKVGGWPTSPTGNCHPLPGLLSDVLFCSDCRPEGQQKSRGGTSFL